MPEMDHPVVKVSDVIWAVFGTIHSKSMIRASFLDDNFPQSDKHKKWDVQNTFFLINPCSGASESDDAVAKWSVATQTVASGAGRRVAAAQKSE